MSIRRGTIPIVLFIALASDSFGQAPTDRSSIRDQDSRISRLITIVEAEDDANRDLAIRTLMKIGPAAKPAIPALCKRLNDSRHWTRAAAVDALVAIGDESVKPLRELLHSSSGRCRAAAATALVRMQRVSDVERQRFANDNDARVRAVAIRTYQSMGKESVADLVKFLSDTESSVAVEAAKALQTNRDAPAIAIPELIIALKRQHVGWAAANALGSYGVQAKRAVPWIIRACPIGEPEQFDFGDVARQALMHIGPPHEDDIQVLVECLEREDTETRILAASALAMLGEQGKPAIAALESTIDAAIKQHLELQKEFAVVGIGKHEDVSLEDNFFDEDDLRLNPVRVMIVGKRCAIAIWNSSRDANRFLYSVERLVRQTGQTVRFDRANPWPALPTDCYPTIERLLDDGNAAVRTSVVIGVSDIGSKALPLKGAVLRLTHDSSPEISRHAISALTSMGPAASDVAGPRALAMFRADQLPLREFADSARQLEYRSPIVLEILENGLNNSGRWDNLACAEALFELTDERRRVASMLIQFPVKHQISRRNLIDILDDAKSVDDLLIPFLTNLLDIDDRWTRHDALNALASLGPRGSPAIHSIVPLLENRSPLIRLKAAKAVFRITGDATPLKRNLERIFSQSGETGVQARLAAIKTIGELSEGGDRFLHHIRDNMDLSEPWAVDTVMESLRRIGTAESESLLRNAADSDDWLVRSRAARAIRIMKATSEAEN